MTEKTQDQDEAKAPAKDTPQAAPEQTEAASVGKTAETAWTAKGDGSAIPAEELERLRTDLIAALKTVFDPEIPADIYELGLIYRVDIDDERNVEIDMTLTAPSCPVAGEMPGWVENAAAAVPGVGQVKVNLVFDPPWDMSRMSDEARVAVGLF